jgi:hypothetical protein
MNFEPTVGSFVIISGPSTTGKKMIPQMVY